MSHIKSLWHTCCKTDRIVVDAEAGNIVVKQLAFENANKACKTALQPNRKRASVQEMITIYADVRPSHIQSIALAAAFLPPRGKKKGACFSSGKEGHFARECQNKPQLQLGISGPHHPATDWCQWAQVSTPPRICPCVREENIGQTNVTPKQI
jgi:hypothetical protein